MSFLCFKLFGGNGIQMSNIPSVRYVFVSIKPVWNLFWEFCYNKTTLFRLKHFLTSQHTHYPSVHRIMISACLRVISLSQGLFYSIMWVLIKCSMVHNLQEWHYLSFYVMNLHMDGEKRINTNSFHMHMFTIYSF